jgi:tetratricopeptide (TPR) repeat protein
VTANFLHASLSHLLLNLAGIAVLGWLAERSLGTTRVALVAGAAGLGAMLGSYASGYERALGASGIVYGLVGALLCLEFRWPESVPVQWRIPRRAFLVALAAETVMLVGASGIAHAAHWGGFAAGVLAVLWLGPRPDAAFTTEPRLRAVRWAAAGLAVAVALSLGAFVRNVASPDAAAIARRGERLLALETVAADLLNNEAWQIAIADDVEAGDLDVAQRMAERAVSASDAADPAFLDTLAEIHFRNGRSEQALELIGAAIGLAPGEPYYREQRRRFLGERAADDRPADPSWPPGAPPDEEPEPVLPPGPPPVRA